MEGRVGLGGGALCHGGVTSALQASSSGSEAADGGLAPSEHTAGCESGSSLHRWWPASHGHGHVPLQPAGTD